MTTKFHHCFTLSDGCGVYATPYSSTGTDFMDGAVSVCQWNGDDVNKRTARILSEMCTYWSIITDEITAGRDRLGFYTYALRRFYSLANRIESIWGKHAARSIFDTMGFTF